MKSLLWKEWRETRGYLAIFMAWMILAVLYSVAYEFGYRLRATVGHFSSLALFYTVCAAVFLAMRTAQGEQTAGTLSFTASLPVSMRRIATARIGVAAATLAVPLLSAATLLALALACGLVEQAAPRGAAGAPSLPMRDSASLPVALEQLGSVTVIAIFGGIELLLLLSLIGCWLRSQTQVGLLGAVLGLGSLIASGLFWYGARMPYAQLVYGVVLPPSLVIQWSYGAEQGGFYTDHELAPYRWVALGLAIPVLVIMGRLFVRQYSQQGIAARATKRRRFRLAIPSIWSHAPIRFRYRWSAMIWLELRQSLPLVTFGLLLAFLVAVASVVMEPQPNYSATEYLRSAMLHSISFVGMLWAAVVGSGLYSAELGSGLGAFWRSRPISSGMWFWCKFIVGLVAVLAVLDGVTILACWNAPRDLPTAGVSWAYVACFPVLHAFLYAMSVLGTCWLRKPVIGAFLALFGFAVLTVVLEAVPATASLETANVYNKLLKAERAGSVDFTQCGYPLVYGTMAASTFLMAFISARLAKPLQPTCRWFTSLSA